SHIRYKDDDYYFCSKACAERFSASPEAFLSRRPAVSHPPMASTVALEPSKATSEPRIVDYTCPMHPEVVQSGPGTCPICGMALEPRGIAADEVNPELVSMTRRFWVSAVLTAPLLLSMAVGHLPPWIQLALATPVVLWGGWPFFERGWQSIAHRSPNMFTLIAIG